MDFAFFSSTVAMTKCPNDSKLKEKSLNLAQQSRLQSLLAQKSKQQEPEATGHMTFTIRSKLGKQACMLVLCMPPF